MTENTNNTCKQARLSIMAEYPKERLYINDHNLEWPINVMFHLVEETNDPVDRTFFVNSILHYLDHKLKDKNGALIIFSNGQNEAGTLSEDKSEYIDLMNSLPFLLFHLMTRTQTWRWFEELAKTIDPMLFLSSEDDGKRKAAIGVYILDPIILPPYDWEWSSDCMYCLHRLFSYHDNAKGLKWLLDEALGSIGQPGIDILLKHYNEWRAKAKWGPIALDLSTLYIDETDEITLAELERNSSDK